MDSLHCLDYAILAAFDSVQKAAFFGTPTHPRPALADLVSSLPPPAFDMFQDPSTRMASHKVARVLVKISACFLATVLTHR